MLWFMMSLQTKQCQLPVAAAAFLTLHSLEKYLPDQKVLHMLLDLVA